MQDDFPIYIGNVCVCVLEEICLTTHLGWVKSLFQIIQDMYHLN